MNKSLESKKEIMLLLLLMIISWVAIEYCYYNAAVLSASKDELVDTDTYMRLVRVEQLAETGDWYDTTIHRSNAPYGEELHWTRPLDIILLGGAKVLSPFMGFDKALLYWGIILSPILGILSIIAVYWATKPFLAKRVQPLFWLVFLSQPVLFGLYMFGRPDHHSLLALLFILLLGLLFRIIGEDDYRSYCIWGGLTAALALWISVEALAAIVLLYLTLGIMWLFEGCYARRFFYFALSLTVASTVFLVIERPLQSLFLTEYDKISDVHILIFVLVSASALLLTKSRIKGLIRRMAILAGLAAANAGIAWLSFPDFFKGPWSQVNHSIVPIWLSRVNEVQTLLSQGIFTKTIIIGPLILGIAYLLYEIKKENRVSRIKILVVLLLGLIVFMPLTFYQIRWIYYGSILLVFILGLFMEAIIIRISAMRKRSWQLPVRVAAILVICCGFQLAGAAVAALYDKESSKAAPEVNLKPLCAWLNNAEGIYQPSTILTFIDFGPQILYRTGHRVIATPYHRNDEGILFSYEVMSNTNMAAVREMLNSREVDLIILCPQSQEKHFYNEGKNQPSFYQGLQGDKTPSGVQPIRLPEELSDNFLVFRVMR